jgi:4-hydroxythreonine-4-phosphate dehydrogenase
MPGASSMRRCAAISRIAAPVIASPGSTRMPAKPGGLGREDIDIVAPAVAELRAAGIDARGPLAADTMFHAAARRGYDAALVHVPRPGADPDQDARFRRRGQRDAGLPFIRTSPDHGTAFDIAGKGVARPDSLIAALAAARRRNGGAARPTLIRTPRFARRCARSSPATASPPARASGRTSSSTST